MPEEFSASLRAGSADFAATVTPAAPDTIRARGNRRRRRQALAAAVLAVAIAAGGAGTAYASLGRSGLAAFPVTGHRPSAVPSVPAGEGRPDIVAVTNRGALVVLDPLTGIARKILVRDGVLAGAVSVSPDGRTVYFGTQHGCEGTIESIPVAGGRVSVIAPGVLPAVSPDGTRVAFVRMPYDCGRPGAAAVSPEVVVRDLAGGGETVLAAGPGPASAGAVPELSWSPDGKRLLVAVARSKGSGSWVLAQVDPATARYYLPSAGSGASVVPVTGPDAAHSYYRGGVFLPGGDLFVNRICCTDGVSGATSNLLWEIDPSGRLVRQVAIGWRDRDHTSLDGDPSGQWLLYLSGPDLFLSLDGAAPFKLTTGLAAAAWT